MNPPGILRLRGTSALSKFRTDRLQAQLAESIPDLEALRAEYWHFVKLNASLDPEQEQVLENLLQYGPREQEVDAVGEKLLVLPRLGTISPWSTKASDIAQRCGLSKIARIERGVIWYVKCRDHRALSEREVSFLAQQLSDPMTESVVRDERLARKIFDQSSPAALRTVKVMEGGYAALVAANDEWGLALSDDEIGYLVEQFSRLERDPTDVELMMFAQVNSEHCRHKIFNAEWVIDQQQKKESLFELIRTTHEHHPEGTLLAYEDNSAILQGTSADRFFANPGSGEYGYINEPIHILCKVETHNHPTAISPFPGAAR